MRDSQLSIVPLLYEEGELHCMQKDEVSMNIWTSLAVAEMNLAKAFFQLKSWQGFGYTCQGTGFFLQYHINTGAQWWYEEWEKRFLCDENKDVSGCVPAWRWYDCS